MTPADNSGDRTPTRQFDNSSLMDAMRAVAENDCGETRRVLYESLIKAWFLVPTRATPAVQPGWHDIKDDIAGSFSLEHDGNGMPVAVVFTDEEALRNWNQTIPWIGLQGSALFGAVCGTEVEDIVINPYEPEDPGSKMIRPGGRVTRAEFEALAQGSIPASADVSKEAMDAQDGPSVLVAMPKEMPAPETLRALAAPAASFPKVLGLYFGQVIYADGVPHWAVAVDFAAGTTEHQMQSVFKALAKEAQRRFHDRDTDFVAVSNPLGRTIAGGGKKFYG